MPFFHAQHNPSWPFGFRIRVRAIGEFLAPSSRSSMLSPDRARQARVGGTDGPRHDDERPSAVATVFRSCASLNGVMRCATGLPSKPGGFPCHASPVNRRWTYTIGTPADSHTRATGILRRSFSISVSAGRSRRRSATALSPAVVCAVTRYPATSSDCSQPRPVIQSVVTISTCALVTIRPSF